MIRKPKTEGIAALQRAEADSKTNEICRKLRISEATFYNWRKQYVGLGVQNCETGEALSATRAEFFDFQVGTAAAVNGHSIES
ncbi:MAG: transposase [Acidobacteriaceae bacterium]|nr:transposase [Acidobacteriaceae bacterium]